MADGVDIDLYANIEEDFNQDTEFGSHGDDLYDDVITASASGDGLESNNHSQKPPSSTISVSSIPANYTGKKYNLYVGNLTWWTTDQDLTDALTTIGVHDLLEIKFFENRANGQSKGFALVVVGSDGSSRAIFDKLSRKEIHGQVPQVTPYSRHALNQLEAASRKGGEGPPQSNNNRGFQNRQEHFGDKSPRGGSRPPTPNNPGKPHFQPRGQPRGPPMPNQGPPPQGPPTGPPPGFAPVRPGGPPPGIPPPGSMPPGAPQMRGPPPSMPRMGPGPPPQLRGPPGMHDPRRPPPLRPDWNPRVPAPFHNAGPPPPQPVPPPGLRPPMSGPPQMPPVSGGPPPGHMPHPGGPPAPSPHVNPAFFPPPHARAPPPGQIVNIPTGDPYGRPPPNSYPPSDSPYGRPSERHEPPPPALSEQEFEEIFQRNKTVSSSAINRAVQDASAGDFASAIETLVTAISLIKQSKIAGDDRCKILISSLQDTLHGIEEKSYGSKSASSTRRSRSRSRERDREREKRSRHRSRSRDRDYERNRERERHYEERHRSDRGERSERERERSEREYAGSTSSSSRRH